jgi:DNA helicase-2/ATP-dependent DNA helicase PcrA
MYEHELNLEQLDVVLHGDGPCLVLAGAGSGKTRTITYRVAYLLSQGVHPENILLVTFTNKASREMIERVEAIAMGGGKLPWAGTFHHIAYRILKKYGGLLGYTSTFTILDSGDSLDILKLCLKGEGINRTEKRFPSPKVLQSIISYARNAETTIADVLDLKHPNWLDIADTITRIAEDYRKRKLEANAMDFDDLLVNLYLLLLKEPAVKQKFANQFQYVLVDEYQDTNKIQASIINQFASVHKNVLVVGDDAQSIYSFRAADIQNILGFNEHYPGSKIFRLETNYRSTPDILNVANEVIANNTRQHQKTLKSLKDAFMRPEVHAFADDREEAEFIAENILELRDEGMALKHIAVLFRAAFHSQALEMELMKRDIPYDYRGGVRFFERGHIKDVLAYLRIVANKDDIVAWSRILNMQVGLGPATVEKIVMKVRALSRTEETSQAERIDLSGIGASLSARAQIGWGDFLSIWQDVITSDQSVSGLIRSVAESTYAEYLENEYPDYRERLQDIEQLATFAETSQDLSTFLAEATMQESFQSAQARGADVDQEKIVLSTIHQAKGLEWEAVFLLGLASGKFPHDRSLRETNGLEEERRLFYVAVTRAKKYLYMTYPLLASFTSSLSGPSMFIEEIDRALVRHEGMREETSIFDSDFDDPSDDVDDISYVPDPDYGSGAPPKRRGILKSIDEL